MTAETLMFVAKAALCASIAMAFVLLLRPYLRAHFGARVAYAFWLIVPVAALATLVPAEFVTVGNGALETVPATAMETAVPLADVANAVAVPPSANAALAVQEAASFDVTPLILAVWIAGFALSIAALVVQQRKFFKSHALTKASGHVCVADNESFGPAVVGLVRPTIVVPKDFASRYSKLERALIMAHENAHIRAGDLRINALAVVVRSLNWFSPLAYIAYGQFRIDQELACDERVMHRHGQHRRVYAETLLKSQLFAQPAPLGCSWLPESMHPLKQRVARLASPEHIGKRRVIGTIALAVTASVSAAAAWASLSSHVVTMEAAERSAASIVHPEDDIRGERDPELAGAQGAALVTAIMEGRTSHARALVKAGADVNYYMPGDGTPLVIAARRGEAGLVNMLLEAGAEAGKAAPGDGSPLIMASRRGNTRIVEMLLEAGADANGIVMGDETPLIGAAANNRLKIAELLIEAGAEVNLKVKTGNRLPRAQYRSPLGQAELYGHSRMAKLLKRHGATDVTRRED